MTALPHPDRIEAIREFNRFYTRRIGVLHENLVHSDYSLAESRLLWEFAHRELVTATELARVLELDAGYVSRLLRRLKERGLIKATRSKDDARSQHLSLTPAGRRAYAPLDSRSAQQVSELLQRLPEPQQQELLQAVGRIGRLLDDSPERAARSPYLLRSHRPGDMGWVVSRHGALYAQEYRWDMRFEAMVARIAADFIDHFDREREASWIAERDGVNVGCVFLVQCRTETTEGSMGEIVDGVAQLRMLLMEPSARGLGIGARLVSECTRFARQVGYRTIRLWTNSLLSAARHLYQQEGYLLISSESHQNFGHDLVGETWELAL